MYMLVDEDSLDAITVESAGGPLILEYRTEQERDQNATPTVKMTMWPLPPLPVPREIVNSNRALAQSSVQGFYLLPVVDGRYWWQFRNVGEISAEDFSGGAQDVLDYLLTRVDEDIAIEELHSEYDLAPDVSSNNYECVADVLDSVAWQLGLTLVPNMTTAEHAAVDTGDKFVLLDPDTSQLIHTDNTTGRGGLEGLGLGEKLGTPLGILGDEIDYRGGLMLPAACDAFELSADSGIGLKKLRAAVLQQEKIIPAAQAIFVVVHHSVPN